MVEEFDTLRSVLFSNVLKERIDKEQRDVIRNYKIPLRYESRKSLMISKEAWQRVKKIGASRRLVFAHPDILSAHPKTSLYYRGLTLLSRKQVTQAAVSVAPWEEGKREGGVPKASALKVARLYNCVISSIIVGSSDWTMENGYRNIVATMGITLDGQFRNQIGQIAEQHIKTRILDWVKDKGIVDKDEDLESKRYSLAENVIMEFGTEPDISFEKDDLLVATIEVKGGTDPAGALERLGAMTKSFNETPAKCENFLIAGVITKEMQTRLDEIAVKVFRLDEVSQDGDLWEDFINELFHHTLRIT